LLWAPLIKRSAGFYRPSAAAWLRPPLGIAARRAAVKAGQASARGAPEEWANVVVLLAGAPHVYADFGGCG
jgi:hypothetical protein